MPYSAPEISIQFPLSQVTMRRAIVSIGVALGFAVAVATGATAQPSAPPNPNRPASTLLLPYFEVDLDNAQGMTTLFSVNNASASATMTHITLWSDLGVPVFAFDVYLTGFDAQTINLRDVLTGTVPRTASAGQDSFSQANQISPQGPWSQDINFASCTGILPLPSVPAVYLPYLRAALTGAPSSFHAGRCVSRNLGTPGIARGYVTVDVSNACALMFPADPGYFFNGGGGIAGNRNIVWGDYMYVNPSQDLGFGDSLVHIQTRVTDPELGTPGEYTFYGRFVNWTAADNREPLSTSFAVRFVSPKDFKTPAKARRRAVLPPSTELLVWRDPKVALTGNNASFTCGSAPPWYPLGQEGVRAFDEQEETEVVGSPANLFPAATQRVAVSSANLPVTIASGWLFLNLNTAVASAGANPPEDPAAAQAWVTVLQRVQQGDNGGRYDVGHRAIRLDNAQNASHVIP
jgi:hypothetical protein